MRGCNTGGKRPVRRLQIQSKPRSVPASPGKAGSGVRGEDRVGVLRREGSVRPGYQLDVGEK